MQAETVSTAALQHDEEESVTIHPFTVEQDLDDEELATIPPFTVYQDPEDEEGPGASV